MERLKDDDDDLGAPDVWETADLDEGMRRILVSSAKAPAPSASPPPDSGEEGTLASGAPASSSGDRRRVSVEALNEVDHFLKEALQKPRERLPILRMEQDVEKFIRDPKQQQLEFQALPTSYLRLAAHRVAQHYNIQSLAVPDNSLPDGSGSLIILHKSSECRLPVVRLADIPVNLPQEDNSNAVKVAIKQRPEKHSQTCSIISNSSKNSHPKTVEERKEEYNRARARIFNSDSGGGTMAKLGSDSTLADRFNYSPSVAVRPGERSIFDRPENNHENGLGGPSSGGNISNRSKAEKDPVVSRLRASNRVAIFRDHDIDRKDPDYDRNYGRYTQRFDPGFGFSGPYTMQPLYTPAVNYNTEFPQLGSGHRPQFSVEHQPQPPQLLTAHWPAASSPTAVRYGPPDSIMAPFNPNHARSHCTSPMYLHSSQYAVPLRPGISFVHPREYVQSFAQTHQEQSEATFELARPC